MRESSLTVVFSLKAVSLPRVVALPPPQAINDRSRRVKAAEQAARERAERKAQRKRDKQMPRKSAARSAATSTDASRLGSLGSSLSEGSSATIQQHAAAAAAPTAVAAAAAVASGSVVGIAGSPTSATPHTERYYSEPSDSDTSASDASARAAAMSPPGKEEFAITFSEGEEDDDEEDVSAVVAAAAAAAGGRATAVAAESGASSRSPGGGDESWMARLDEDLSTGFGTNTEEGKQGTPLANTAAVVAAREADVARPSALTLDHIAHHSTESLSDLGMSSLVAATLQLKRTG